MRRLLPIVLVTVTALPLFAQTADRDLPKGKELVVVYVGAKSCGPCLLPATKAAVREVNRLLAAAATKGGYAFSAMGVSTDWSTADGVSFLADNGPFDQLVIGGNWANLAAEHFIWRQPGAVPAMPQVIVVERTVMAGESGVTFTAPRTLHRVFGGDEIQKWAAAGAPLPPP
jgi:hypothetical protein